MRYRKRIKKLRFNLLLAGFALVAGRFSAPHGDGQAIRFVPPNDYMRPLQSISRRVVIVRPPAHDLTDYWQQGGQLRPWLASIVVQHLEQLLNALDDRRYPDLWAKWYKIHHRAWQATKSQADNHKSATV